MSRQTRVTDIATTLLGPRERSGRWVYLLAMLLPAWGTLDEILRSFPTYGYQHWVSAGLIFVCGVQFYRPTFALWLPVFLWYAWASAGAIWGLIETFQDYGSEDHSRWEGWQTVRKMLGKPMKITPFELKKVWHYDWRYMDGPNTSDTKIFTVVFNSDLKVLSTESVADPALSPN